MLTAEALDALSRGPINMLQNHNELVQKCVTKK